MKNYVKPVVEITKITTSEAIASSPVVSQRWVTTDEENIPVTVYEVSFDSLSETSIG